MVDFFIRRPVFASVCAMILVLAGAISIPTLPVAQFPQLAPPQITVSSSYTGASAQAVETAVTTPLEQAINGVEGMRYIQSTSGNDGSSSITATFDLSRNLDVAAVDVQNRVASAQGRLPNEVKTTGVTVAKNSSAFVLALGLFAPHGEYDALWISNYADVFLKDAIKRVPGVGDVIIFGERKYAMRLWLDPDRLAARKLTADDVVSALQEQNVQVPAGQLGQPPAPPGQQFQISVRAVGRLIDPAQFDQIVLKAAPDGTIVRLQDVGRAELGAESYGTNLRFNGIDAVGLGVLQLPTANALAVDKAVRAELGRLAKSFPPGLEYRVAFDTTTAVSESIREVLVTLLEAIALVILVIFLFLQDWRMTLIPAITIPVSLVGTFTFVKLLGFSINTLTLFGITLATGLVVDDAIVVIENIERHIRERHLSAPEAASSAMKEVAGAVIATSLVLVAVFVPVGVLPRHDGRPLPAVRADDRVLGRPLGLQRADADPGARGAAPRTRAGAAEGRVLPGSTPRSRRRRAVTAIRCRGSSGGRGRWAPPSSRASALTYLVFRKVPTAFVPDEDQGYFIVAVQAPPGASLDYTNKIAARVSATLMREPEVAGRLRRRGLLVLRDRVEQGDRVRAAEAPLRAARLPPFRRRGDRARPRASDGNPGSDRHSVRAAADSRRQPVRRVPVRGARPGGRVDRAARRGDEGSRRPGQPRSGAAGTLHRLHGERPAAPRHDRPRAGEGRSASISLRSPTRCRSTWARCTSTTSISTTAPTA